LPAAFYVGVKLGFSHWGNNRGWE